MEGVSITRVQQGPILFSEAVLGVGQSWTRLLGLEGEGKGWGVVGLGGEEGSNTSVQVAPGCLISAEFVLRVGVVLVDQFDVREGEVAPLAFAFALPLAVDVDFGHLHHIAHL